MLGCFHERLPKAASVTRVKGRAVQAGSPPLSCLPLKAGAGAITLFNAACPACPKARVIKANIPNIVPDAAAKRDFTIIHMIDTVLLPSL
jgi:hypothetical protein